MINFKKYGKRCLSLFLAASMILMPAVQTFAEEETAAATTDSTQTAEEDRERHSVRTVMRSHQIQTVWRTGHRDRQLMRTLQSLWI